MAPRQPARPAGKKAPRKRKAKEKAPARKGGKGYQRSQDHTPETMPSTTVITGSVGTVENLWSLIDKRLQEMDINWTTMGRRIRLTRQYIYDCLQRGRMPYAKLRLICGILGWDVHDVIAFTHTSRAKDHHDEEG